MIIRQISKNKKNALTKSAETESAIDNYSEYQYDEKIDPPEDSEYVKPKDFTMQESKPADNSYQEKKPEDTPEFFLDKEKESEENKE